VTPATSVAAAFPVGLDASVDAARRHLAREFRSRGLDSPELDARVLVGHALGLDQAGLASQSRRALSPDEATAVAALAARRLAREPVARIVGYKEFWGLPFRLNADTLLPRPETETVVEAALAAVGHRRSDALRIADLGTGTGALLVALLSELPGAVGVGTDISLAALDCARENAMACGVGGRAAFVACDYGAGLAGRLDLLVSNPPYVARGDIATLQSEVRDFDPRRALDGGPDGLDGYRVIAADAQRLLSPSGILVLELGQGQLTAVRALFCARGLAPMATKHDLSDVVRALVLRLLP